MSVDELRHGLHVLINEFIVGNDHLLLYQRLDEAMKAHPAAYRLHAAFFNTTRNALLEKAHLHLGRILDGPAPGSRSDRPFSFPHFLDAALNHLEAFAYGDPEDVKEQMIQDLNWVSPNELDAFDGVAKRPELRLADGTCGESVLADEARDPGLVASLYHEVGERINTYYRMLYGMPVVLKDESRRGTCVEELLRSIERGLSVSSEDPA